MFQIYLLTVLTNILAGHVLARKYLNLRFVSGGPYRVTIGVVSLLIGMINLFPIYEGSIPVLGNFLPSLAGFTVGVLILVEYAKGRKGTTGTKTTEAVEPAPGPFSTIAGLASILIGVLHALFPKAVIF